jgi:hypothetical protein
MRTYISGLLFITAAGTMFGCNSAGPTSSQSPATQAVNAAKGKPWVMPSGGAGVLKLTAPNDIKCVTGDGMLHFTAAKYEVECWLVPGAQTVDDAVGRVSTQISSEFKDFKPEKTAELTIAGSPAKRLVGSGHEADDGDPGDADVIIFTVGNHIFVACNHGESLDPVGQKAMLAIVQTAQAP